LIEATSMAPWKTYSRLSVRVATARKALSLLKARSAVLRCLQDVVPDFGGRPPAEPFAARAFCWSLFSGIVVLIRHRRRWDRIVRF
jgi:hypothetical protein